MRNLYFLIGFFLGTTLMVAQEFEASLQLRPRFEFRNGYKTLLENEQDPVTFVSQRSRLNLGFLNENLKMKVSLQNTRVWGDVPLLTTADKNGIGVFEAWGQYSVSSTIGFRLGRQVLSYDNQRILGEVDWAQQGQSHDAAMLQFFPYENNTLDVGVAINSEKEELFKNAYQVNNYKNMQFGWYNIITGSSEISFLLLNAGYETEISTTKREVQYMQTWGSYYQFSKNKWNGNIAAYGQTGEKNGSSLNAWYSGANLYYKLSISLGLGVGAEYLSGTDMENTSEELNSFTPLFGTNHGFNGYMDYFYVGNHQNSVGLIDIYTKFSFSKGKYGFTLTPHFFTSEADIKDFQSNTMDKYLGTEIDFTGYITLSKSATVAFGYSQMFGSESLKRLKGGDPNSVQNWAWISVKFHPKLFFISLTD